MGSSALAIHVLNESSFEFGEKPDRCIKNMHEELLLGTAVAPSHMYLFPLGTKYFIGTTGKVYSLKSSNNPTILGHEC
jgi:hypothetical protein